MHLLIVGVALNLSVHITCFLSACASLNLFLYSSCKKTLLLLIRYFLKVMVNSVGNPFHILRLFQISQLLHKKYFIIVWLLQVATHEKVEVTLLTFRDVLHTSSYVTSDSCICNTLAEIYVNNCDDTLEVELNFGVKIPTPNTSGSRQLCLYYVTAV